PLSRSCAVYDWSRADRAAERSCLMEARKAFAPALAFVAALAAPLPAGDGRAYDVRPQTQANVDIFDRTEGRVLPIYSHQGRRYIVGKPGNEYAIRVRNGGSGRIL